MNYYKAYEKRYKQGHDKNMLWNTTENTIEVEKIISKYNISKNDKISIKSWYIL